MDELDEVAGNGFDDDGNGWVDGVYGADCVNNDGNPIDVFPLPLYVLPRY